MASRMAARDELKETPAFFSSSLVVMVNESNCFGGAKAGGMVYKCCMCSYVSHRFWHARLHFQRVHIHQGKPMEKKRRYILGGASSSHQKDTLPWPSALESAIFLPERCAAHGQEGDGEEDEANIGSGCSDSSEPEEEEEENKEEEEYVATRKTVEKVIRKGQGKHDKAVLPPVVAEEAAAREAEAAGCEHCSRIQNGGSEEACQNDGERGWVDRLARKLGICPVHHSETGTRSEKVAFLGDFAEGARRWKEVQERLDKKMQRDGEMYLSSMCSRLESPKGEVGEEQTLHGCESHTAPGPADFSGEIEDCISFMDWE